MSDLSEIEFSLRKYRNAIVRLEEALNEKDSPLAVDGTIQRFEFTFELSWKTLKRVLAYEGEICKTPRECLKSAFRLGLIDDETVWLNMLEDRNAMAHIYDEKSAMVIYQRIPAYLKAFQKLAKEIMNLSKDR